MLLALASLLEVFTALLETLLGQEPPLASSATATRGTVLLKNHRKIPFSKHSLCVPGSTGSLTRVQETKTSLKRCTFLTETQTPYSFSCRLLLVLHFSTQPSGAKTGKSEEWTDPVISFITELVVTGETGLRLPPGFFHLHKCIPGATTAKANDGVSAVFHVFPAEALSILTAPKGHWWRGFIVPEVQQRKKQLLQ